MKTAAARTAAPDAPAARPSGQRLVSLDAFRGITMALMVLVNNPGDGAHSYAPLQHANWNGWTPTDTVFPSFMWIVGVALTFSLARRVAEGVPRTRLLLQACRRAALLYLLGILVYVYPAFDPSTQRLLGVLQRIGICYLLAVVIYLTTGIRGQVLWIVGLLAGYWALMALVPVPGYGAGDYSVAGNLAHYVDRVVLGRHNYASTVTWDPEGIVSTVPAIATVLFGVMAGHILRLKRTLSTRVLVLLGTGLLLMAAGLVCDQWLPINKKLWTSSFALFMAGLDFSVFALFLWLVDGRGYQRFTRPLVILGMNAIAVYMASELLDTVLRWIRVAPGVPLRDWLYNTLFVPLASPYNASLLYALANVSLMFLLAFGMYRRRWFLRV
jgi:predicted acyltransferase